MVIRRVELLFAIDVIDVDPVTQTDECGWLSEINQGQRCYRTEAAEFRQVFGRRDRAVEQVE